jgi:prepilin-type processing-associated H-X9-DG protein
MFAVIESRVENTNGLGPRWIGLAWDFGICGFRTGNQNITDWAIGWDNPPRHGRNYNVLSCDGHVSALDPRVLFNPVKTAVNWNNDHQSHEEVWNPSL